MPAVYKIDDGFYRSVQDSCYHVRLRFALKLHKGLFSLRLPLEYMSIFSLAANDPLKERRTQLKQFLTSNIQKRREYLKQSPSARSKFFSLSFFLSEIEICSSWQETDDTKQEQRLCPVNVTIYERRRYQKKLC